jgi:hypothetical protein
MHECQRIGISGEETPSLVDLIEQKITDSAHRVLIRAYESIGDCTYARHLPGYLSALKSLDHFVESRSVFGYDRQWRMRALMQLLTLHHREMYRQPCLICPSCQMRSKRWADAAYSMFGEPQRKDAMWTHVEPVYFVPVVHVLDE